MPAMPSSIGAPSLGLRAAVVAVHYGLTVGGVVLALSWRAWSFGISTGDMIHYTSLALLILFGWSFGSWVALTRSWFDPYCLFLVAAFLFNAGQAFLEVFDLNNGGLLSGEFSQEAVCDTLFLVFLGLAGLHFGALVSVGAAAEAPATSDQAGPGAIRPADIRLTGWILLAVSIVPAVLVSQGAIQRVMSGGYESLYQAEQQYGVRAYLRILMSFLVPAAFFLLAGSKGMPKCIAASTLVLLANSGCQLFLGYRYSAVMPVVAYLWVWHRCIRPVPKSFLIGMGVVLIAVVLPLVGATRNVQGENRLSLDFLRKAFSSLEAPPIALISEMGGSMSTVAYTMEFVPSEQRHDDGLSYLFGALTIFPNLFWDVHPSIAHGTPSNWLVWRVDPELAERGGSFGYSFIAEAYLNFGWAGTPLVTALLGFFYGKFVGWGLNSGEQGFAAVAMVGCFAAYFTFYAREDIPVVFRPLVWYCLAPYGLIVVIAKLRRRSAGGDS